jgi:hypothetical protein
MDRYMILIDRRVGMEPWSRCGDGKTEFFGGVSAAREECNKLFIRPEVKRLAIVLALDPEATPFYRWVRGVGESLPRQGAEGYGHPTLMHAASR